MNGKRITGLSNVPYYNGEATNKRYVDTKVNVKADKSDLVDYMKLDGTSQMQGDLNMNNKRITRLPDPQLADEPVTRKFLTLTNTHFYNVFLDLDGNSKMRGNIQMNDKRITGLTNPPSSDDEATNKKYVDTHISKSNIKPSHSPKNVFQDLMNDVNEWSSEYGVKVESFSDLAESPHYWDKRVLNITPVKSGNNYRCRLGLQMFRMKTNESYSLMVELYNRDYKTWQRQQTYVNGTGMWVISNNTAKYQHQYGSSGDLYYSKTLIKFKKTSSTAPIFVYFTVHFDDNGGDMNTYPKDFKNQVYIVAYEIEGLTDHVDSGVYDAHEAFEIDKAKMKMLVPLDVNGKQLMNVNYGAFVIEHNKMKMNMPLNMNGKDIVNFKLNPNFGHVFNLIKCTTNYSNDRSFFILARKDNRLALSFTIPVIINSITFHNKHTFHKDAKIRIITPGLGNEREFKLINLIDNGLTRNLAPWLQLSTGLRYMRLSNLINNIRSPFDVDVIVSYM